MIKTCSCLHVNQLVTSCASDLSHYARPIDQLAAARVGHKDISMLHNSSTQKPSASICVQKFVAPWMLMRILYCWIKERISSTHRHLGIKPSEPNEEYYQENSHDEAFSITRVLLTPDSYFQCRAKQLAQMALGVDSNIRKKPLIST